VYFQLFKPKEDKDDSTKTNVEPPKALLTACKQIVDCLIENVLRLEETSLVQEEQSHGSSQRLVACLTTLYLFAKIRPQLLVDHAITLQPYLSLKCQVNMLIWITDNTGWLFYLTVVVCQLSSVWPYITWNKIYCVITTLEELKNNIRVAQCCRTSVSANFM
jgi:hypothetical protein